MNKRKKTGEGMALLIISVTLRDFVERANSIEKIIILSTSGRGDNMLPDVDGISATSRASEIKEKANEIVTRVTSIINKNKLTENNKDLNQNFYENK